MNRVEQFLPYKLVVPTILSDRTLLDPVERDLEGTFGATDYVSSLLPFEFTRYYEAEMGGSLLRVFFSFAKLVDPAELAEIKIRTNEIERKFSDNGQRRANLDPGLLAPSRLILATTKDYAHRIPLSRGIFGEVTLLYQHGQFVALPWTYPDYRSKEYQRILGDIRALLP